MEGQLVLGLLKWKSPLKWFQYKKVDLKENWYKNKKLS